MISNSALLFQCSNLPLHLNYWVVIGNTFSAALYKKRHTSTLIPVFLSLSCIKIIQMNTETKYFEIGFK